MNLLKGLFRPSAMFQTRSKPIPPQPILSEPIPSKPITRELLSKAERIAHNSASHIYRTDENTVVKTGDAIRLAEALAMRYVRDNTSVPVPKVFDAYVDDESKHVHIVMEYIDGHSLDEEWDAYSADQKRSVIEQLRQYMDELRRITGTSVCSVDGSYCDDQFLNDDSADSGPFDSEASFHEALINTLRARGSHAWTEIVVRFIQALPNHNIVLTHNDLAPRNILVRDAKVLAIVDWEFAGFYPEYWEYVKAYCWPDWQSSWIREGVIDKILQPYTIELAYIQHVRNIIW